MPSKPFSQDRPHRILPIPIVSWEVTLRLPIMSAIPARKKTHSPVIVAVFMVAVQARAQNVLRLSRQKEADVQGVKRRLV